ETLCRSVLAEAFCATFDMISAKAKRPIEMATNSRPDIRFSVPKVKRLAPLFKSVPTVPRIRPITTMPIALMIDPLARITAANRPTIISEKYSGYLNDRAALAKIGEQPALQKVEMTPASTEGSAWVAR